MIRIKSVSSVSRFILTLSAVAALSACSSVAYRCPLDSTEKPDSPTACVGMQEALTAAKKGYGGKQSALLDDKGRIIPAEVLHKKAVSVINNGEPYAEPSGTPQYRQPKVFSAWTPAYVDASGNLHDGRTSYFTTPGEWRYGSVAGEGTRGSAVAENLFRPARAGELPEGKIIPANQVAAAQKAQNAQAVAVKGAKDAKDAKDASAQPAASTSDKAALQSLSNSAQAAAAAQNGAASKASAPAQVAPGVTAPGLQLAD